MRRSVTATATAAAVTVRSFYFYFSLTADNKAKYKCQQIGSARMNVKILHAAIYMHEFR